MTGKVAVITGGSQGIGAGLVAGYRRRGWAVVACARTFAPSADHDLLTVESDIAQPGTADRIIAAALDRFGRVDTLVNNAGVFISKPFTDYTAADYGHGPPGDMEHDPRTDRHDPLRHGHPAAGHHRPAIPASALAQDNGRDQRRTTLTAHRRQEPDPHDRATPAT